ncbi:hypothetical protein MNBD_IGNAVI01-1567 [hydrothermal vent metagenome]|uniref:Secretion system C-terminal sorting domain-containing protein n=1 Tax=hydrothermal vent metagenome TaxID=652676 RepID=A0A3B1BXF6_9ZZZZ
MKKLVLQTIFVLIATSFVFAQATYVGPERCLQCHNNPGLHDATGWRTSMHANGYSVVLNDSLTMQDMYGVINDYDGNGIDDFHDGLNFNNITSAFDKYKPNAPILAYSDADGYTITMGEVTYKVYLTYGGSGLYKQRYGVKIPASDGTTKGIYISPIQFNEKTSEYVLYHDGDWYNSDNTPKYNSSTTLAEAVTNGRSLTKGCAGCHTTGLEVSQDTNGEWLASGAGVEDESLYAGKVNYFDIDGDGDLDQINTGCERCHGPGSEHASSGDKTKIINPKDLTAEQANNLCGMCHSRGKSKPNNTFGYPFHDDTLEGWNVGDIVSDIYTDGGGYWGDKVTSVTSSKQHHQQFYDFYQSSKPTFQFHQVTCYECHDVHNTEKHHIVTEVEEEDSLGNPIVIATENDNNTLCLSCHATHGDFADISVEMVADYANNVDGIGTIVSEHSNHPYDPEGTGASRCSKCHMPKVAKSAIAYDIHSHTFEPIPPQKTKDFAMPNACAVSCHAKTSYPNFDVPITDADFTDWGGTNQQALADELMKYYGPGGSWWDVTVSVHLANLDLPKEFELAQNYPNPFNPSTTINFSIPKESHVVLTVYNSIGQLITTLTNKDMGPGNYFKVWNATNQVSGVYFYRLETDNFVTVKKMLLVK